MLVQRSWYRIDFIKFIKCFIRFYKVAAKQLGDKEVYQEVSNDDTPLLKTINAVIVKA